MSETSIEEENREIQLRQTRAINKKLLEIRTTTRKRLSVLPPLSLAGADTIPSPPKEMETPRELLAARSTSPYHTITSHVDNLPPTAQRGDDPSSFTIPERHKDTPAVSSRILESLKRARAAKKEFLRKGRVLRRWRLV